MPSSRSLRLAPLAPIALALSLLALAGCGGEEAPIPDAGADVGPVDAFRMICGNGMVEGTEECDDDNRTPDDGCSATCTLECGDGMVSGAELCDTGIAPGSAGACPADCDDGDVCTTDALDGSEADCTLYCSNAPITLPIDDDGCCPSGATAANDNDCSATCGDGTVDAGETCDTVITTGAGACPTSCDDGIACTADALTGSACTAACTSTPITAEIAGDGCCPSAGSADPDCAGTCGDGTLDTGEACDTGIAAGSAGACPTSCDDGNACTNDVLLAAGTCSAACMRTTITTPAAGDGCCPAGATVATDSDCAPRCGDGVVTPPEACDDGNANSGDGCSISCMIEPTGFSFTDLDIRDPHLFANVAGCADVTDTVLGAIPGVNPTMQDALRGDTRPADGWLDMTVLHVFDPRVQAAGSTTPSWLSFAAGCMPPYTSPDCFVNATSARTSASVTNYGGGMPCLEPVPGTLRSPAYSPALIIPTAPTGGTCFVASTPSVTFSLGGIDVTLTDAAIAGEWFGNPATEIRDGMIRGFYSEADADAAIIPAGTTGISGIDGMSVSSLLRGGSGNCSEPSPMAGDADTGPAGARGWYFYLNFTAVRVSSLTFL